MTQVKYDNKEDMHKHKDTDGVKVFPDEFIRRRWSQKDVINFLVKELDKEESWITKKIKKIIKDTTKRRYN